MHQFFPLMTYRYDGVNKPSGGWRLTHLEQGYVVESSFDVDQVASCHLITSQRGGWALMEIQSAEREVPPRRSHPNRPHLDCVAVKSCI
jgi:hypothetical protein